MTKIADFPRGYFGTFADNELELVSTIGDPCKNRYAVDAAVVESNLGGDSYNVRRPDGNHEEYALTMGRLTADKRGGAWAIYVRHPETGEMREVGYFDSGAVVFHAPVQAPNIGSGGGHAPNEMRHPDGIHWFVMQGDGNLVVYRNRVAGDYATGDALFDTQSLLARLAAVEAR